MSEATDKFDSSNQFETGTGPDTDSSVTTRQTHSHDRHSHMTNTNETGIGDGDMSVQECNANSDTESSLLINGVNTDIMKSLDSTTQSVDNEVNVSVEVLLNNSENANTENDHMQSTDAELGRIDQENNELDIENDASVIENDQDNVNNSENETAKESRLSFEETSTSSSLSAAEPATSKCEYQDRVASPASTDLEVTHDETTPTKCSTKPSAVATHSEGASSNFNDSSSCVYYIKWIPFNTEKIPIVTQNENGPCPLLAIMNILLLRGKVKFPPMMEMITSEQLMSYLGDCIFQNAPENITEDVKLNWEQNMHDAMAVFHKLQTGLDVNVKFTSVSDFEYTSECIVFDLLNIPLYHGWLVDPNQSEVCTAVGNCSYNQLVEQIINDKNNKNPDLVTKAMIAEDFLEGSAAQLTYHGLCELASKLKENELCVFFRNNHFSTLHKYEDELFLLVTDQGFLTESNVVWETLSNVEGDGHFVDGDFRSYRKPSLEPITPADIQPGTDQQIDHDYLVALTLQQESEQASQATWQQPSPEQNVTKPASTGSWGEVQKSQLSDHELAVKLQEEENRRAAAAAAVQDQPPVQTRQRQSLSSSTSQSKKKDKDCILL